MTASIDDLLAKAVEVGASDLHLKVGSPPVFRIDGELHITNLPTLRPADTEGYAGTLMTTKATADFDASNEADFAFGRQDIGRFRVNVFRQRGSVSLVLRRVSPTSFTFDELGLPPILAKLSAEKRGLVLVTGPTGSGKTTTMAAMVEEINTTRRAHIITIEDPIEVLHADRESIIAQREVGVDTADYHEAVRRAMRQDPDVIIVGEIRDPETVKAAMQAAETGHLVISSMHTADATETINRIVDFFPPYQQKQIRLSLAAVLRGVVSQRLLEAVDGGRVLAVEVLTMNGRVFDRMVDEDQSHTLVDVIKESEFYGMQTFDQAILELFRTGKISQPTGLANASNPHDFRVKVDQLGLVDV